MKVLKGKNEDGNVIECVLLDTSKYWGGGYGEIGCSLFEDMDDYGATYSYDIDRELFVRERFPKKL